MSTLPKSIADIWAGSETLCALVPFERVFTGRVPQTQAYPFPYVSILCTPGRNLYRTDKTTASSGPVSFHIWVDDADLATGIAVAEAIAEVYADRCWAVSSSARVLDFWDEGEPIPHQTDIPAVKAWEVVKLFTAMVERDRVSHDDNCCELSEGSSSSSTS